jgi:hypothetical protein
LKVSHPDYGDFITSKEIDVQLKPVSLTMCVAGGEMYECGKALVTNGNMCGASVPVNSTYFKVTAESLPGLQYKWWKLIEGNSTWNVVGTDATDFLTGVSPNSKSFYIQCEVTAPDGRKGQVTYKIDVNPCDQNTGK